MTKLIEKQLTQMQKIFANLYVENFYGKTSLNNTEIAIKAGYAPDSAYQRAYELLVQSKMAFASHNSKSRQI